MSRINEGKKRKKSCTWRMETSGMFVSLFVLTAFFMFLFSILSSN